MRALVIYNYRDMATSYRQISKEIGYVGYLPFPSIGEMDQLMHRLSSNPTISDFKTALSLYRFLPESNTPEQEKMVYMLQLGLSEAKRDLFQVQPRQTFTEAAINYIMNLIP